MLIACYGLRMHQKLRDEDNVVCNFVDKYITAVLPTDFPETQHDRNLIQSLQKHRHSDHCQRKKTCRFGFPKPPSVHTVISRKPEGEETEEVTDNAKKIFQAVQYELALLDDTTGVSIEDLFNRLNINTEAYVDALQISHKGPNIILKHNPKDVFINACNHDILNLWGGNVNLQYVINEIATVMYVCSYMTKGEKAMGETLKRVA